LKYDELENELKKRIEWINSNYLGHHDHSSPKEIQMLKGCMRESEGISIINAIYYIIILTISRSCMGIITNAHE
jgi:hypothetical protein